MLVIKTSKQSMAMGLALLCVSAILSRFDSKMISLHKEEQTVLNYTNTKEIDQRFLTIFNSCPHHIITKTCITVHYFPIRYSSKSTCRHASQQLYSSCKLAIKLRGLEWVHRDTLAEISLLWHQ